MSSVDTDIRRTDTRPQDIDPRASATRAYVAEQRRTNWRADARKDPEDLEREIDETRADVRATLEALERRFSRDHLLDMTLGRMRSYGGEFAGNLGDAVKQNPVPLLLTSIGLAWMMMSNRRDGSYDYASEQYGTGDAYATSRGGFRTAMHSARDRFGDATDRVGETTASAKERFSGAASSAKERIGETAESAKQHLDEAASAARQRWERARNQFGNASESAREGFQHTRERMHHAADSFREGTSRAASMTREQWSRARSEADHLVHEQPLMLGALGFAAGALIGALLPPSETEDRMVGEARDRAMRTAREAGEQGYREVRDRAKDLAENAKERLRETNGNGTTRSSRDDDAESRAAGSATDATRGRERDYGESEDYNRAVERDDDSSPSSRRPDQRPH